MSTVNTAARTEADAAEHAEDAEALAKWKAANPKKIAAIIKTTMAMAKAPIEVKHATEAAIMSLIDSSTAEELEGESVKDMAESIFEAITCEPRRAADLAKRLRKELKNPAAALERAREAAQREEMQDEKDEEKTSCRENGESWSDIKEEWEAEWLENNWTAEAEAEFIVGFEKDWLKDHGTPYPAAEAVTDAPEPVTDDLAIKIGDAVKAHDTADATRKEKAIIVGNTTTKADLFSRAKDAIEAGDQSLHAAAEALALAQEDFKASQREIAEAVGKSVAWVNRLLQWQRQGYVGTPFGPGSRARRERQKSVQAPEQRAPQSAKSPRGITSNDVMSGFNSYVTALGTKIGKHKVDHFLATPVPADVLAKVGNFLCDLAILKKSELVRPAPTTALTDNTTLSAQQSDEGVREDNDADAVDD